MSNILAVLIGMLFISSCGAPAVPAPTPTPARLEEMPLAAVTPVCVSPEPAQADIDRALSFARAVIEPDKWQQSYSAAEGYVAVTWQNIPLSAVIYLEARIKPCGYQDADLDRDFSDENWQLILQNYEGHELSAACKTGDGLRLYQFKAHNQGLEYSLKYWVRSDTERRVITAMFVFPRGSESVMDDYAARLFPELTACSRE